jgi:molybdopterin molybdotransferase
MLRVRKMPRVVIVSTGNELVDVAAVPSLYQVRKSNSYSLFALLQAYGITAEMSHVADDYDATSDLLTHAVNRADVVILSGGISMGKFDHVPGVLDRIGVTSLFRKVNQRPGKPFSFGMYQNRCAVFLLPGNPVSALLCAIRYVEPWLRRCLNIPEQPLYARLDEEIKFQPAMQFFHPVSLHYLPGGTTAALPVTGNGSGDYANLITAQAFLELPSEKNEFSAGEVFRIWLVP